MIREVIERMRSEALHDVKGAGILLDRVQISLEAGICRHRWHIDSVSRIFILWRCEPKFLGTHQGTVELLRLRATASMAHYEVAGHTLDGHAPNEAIKGHRDAIWGRVSDPATLFTWEALRPGHEVSGGVTFESAWTTYPVLPGWVLRIDEYGNGHLQRR